MAQTGLPNVGINYEHTLGADDFKNSYDTNWVLTDLMAQPFVLSQVTTSEPGSPVVGDAYILASSPTGGNWGSDTGAVEDSIAVFVELPGLPDSSDWVYLVPRQGWKLFNRATNQWLEFDGSQWFVAENKTVNSVAGTSYTMSNDDLEAVVIFSSGGAVTITVDDDAGITLAKIGSRIHFTNENTTTITVSSGGAGNSTVNRNAITLVADEMHTFVKTAANTWQLFG